MIEFPWWGWLVAIGASLLGAAPWAILYILIRRDWARQYREHLARQRGDSLDRDR